MGTNYYTLANPTCDNPAHTEELHIGKSSMGWKFGFQGHPQHGLTSWLAYQSFLTDKVIKDEYGKALTLDEFRPIVEDRSTPRDLQGPICRVSPESDACGVGYAGDYHAHGDYHDPDGFDFYDGEFS